MSESCAEKCSVDAYTRKTEEGNAALSDVGLSTWTLVLLALSLATPEGALGTSSPL